MIIFEPMIKSLAIPLLFILTLPLGAQSDTLKGKKVTRMFTLSPGFTEIMPVEIDTFITGFQQYKNIEKLTPFYISLGNNGLPVLETDFFKRNRDFDHFPYRFVKPYMHHTANNTFIDTQVPFTELKFFFGGPRNVAEQVLGIRHSQNVNQNFNVGLNLDVINSLGQYSYQKAENKSFTLHTSYLGKRYQLLGAWSLNNMTRLENGGVAFENMTDSGSGDPSFLAGYDTRDVPVNLDRLNSAGTEMRNRNLLLVQSYRIGGDGRSGPVTGRNRDPGTATGIDPATDPDKRVAADALVEKITERDTVVSGKGRLEGTLTHIMTWDRTGSLYHDSSPLSGFYDTTYISSATVNYPTSDTLSFRVLKNSLKFGFAAGSESRFRLGIEAGIRNELYMYSQNVPTFSESLADTIRNTASSNALTGRVFNTIGDRFAWEANGELWFTGLRAGDFILKGNIEGSLGKEGKGITAIARGELSSQSPHWWQNQWGSNNFIWKNDFSNEVSLIVGGEITMPGLNLLLSADYALLTDHIWYDNNALPGQYSGSISVLSIRAENELKFWKFRFRNRLLTQSTSHASIIPLPLLTVKSSLSLDHEFRFKSTGGRLETSIGAEVLWFSPYYGPAYMPATGIFHTQDHTQTGNYPYLNVFLNLKLKRTRGFIAFDHVNQGLSGYDYFMVPGYPQSVRTFRYGIAWTFYN